ncbi:unnamed protein product [Urochloa humidicola]
MDAVDDRIPGDPSSEEEVDEEIQADEEEEEDEEEEVDSDGSPFRAGSSPERDGAEADILWMPEGDMEFAYRVAYAFLDDDAPTGNPAPFIRSAIYSVAKAVHYRMFPSTRGAMMLLFDSRTLRDAVVADAPIVYNGGTLTFEKSEESSNRFLAVPDWLLAVSCSDFPPEHWKLANIPAAFRKLGTVVEIDPECLLGNYSSLRVVIERPCNTPVPPTLSVGNPRTGLGSVFHVEVLQAWRREAQLNAAGRLRPFFPPPPGPNGGAFEPANGLGPDRGNFGPSGLLGPGRFPSYDTFYYGYINDYPLPPLPSFPLVIHSAAAPPHFLPILRSTPLRLTWHDQIPPPPPPSPARTTPPPPASPPTSIPPARRTERGRPPSSPKPRRASSRLAAKEAATYTTVAGMAMERKALREGLANCSKDLQRQVYKRKILKKKNPLGALDLGRLAKAAGLGCSGRHAVAVAAATGVCP